MRVISSKTGISLFGIIGTFIAMPVCADMGRTPGKWAVTPSGAASYSIPLWIPPGPKGVQPSLAFVYSSQSGNGTMGVGWALSGFGSVERCAWSIAEDGSDRAVRVDAQDRFCIGGNKLRITSGPLASYGSTGAVYQTQIANFDRVTSVGSAGTGPESFLVHAKNGLIYEYGATADSRVIIAGTTVYRWLLNKVSDRDGNSYVVTYTTSNSTGRVPLSVSWGPVSAGSSSFQYKATFNYITKTNEKDIPRVLEQGYDVPTKQRLESVEIGYSASGTGHTIKRQYMLTYESSPTTGQSRLTTIKECAATPSECLKPTTIAYQNGAAGVSNSPSTGLSSANGTLAGKYDFNGDGRTDLAYFNGSTWRVAFSTGAGFGTGVDTGISTTPQAGRFVANGQDGFLVNASGTWNYVSYNGTGFTSASTNTSVTTGSILTDYNGDGLQDFVWTSAASGAGGWTGFVHLRLNTTSGAASVPSFDTTVYSPLAQPLGNFGGNISIVPATRCPIERHCDINGDSGADLSVVVTTTFTCSGGPGGCTPVNTGYDLVTGGYGYFLANPTPNSVMPYLGFNFNSDRCTDKIRLATTSMTLYGCGTATPVNVTAPAQAVGVIDWDGDGRSDLLVNNGGTLGIYQSSGSTANPFQSVVSTSIPYSSGCAYFAIDVEGDGLDELACASSSSLSYYNHNGGGSVGLGGGVVVFATQIPDLAASISDGYGVSMTPGYVSTAQSSYTKGTGTAFPLVDSTSPMVVVARLSVSDGIGGTYHLDYAYRGARRHATLGTPHIPWYVHEKKPEYKPEADGLWAGFEQIDVVDSRSGQLNRALYEQSFPAIGLLKQSSTYQSNLTSLIQQVTNTNNVQVLDAATNNQRYFQYVSQVVTDDYEVGGSLNSQLIKTTTRTNEFTDFTYGNPSSITTIATDKDSLSSPSFLNSTWTKSTTFTYDSPRTSGLDWCIGFVTRSQTTESSSVSGSATIVRTVDQVPDSSNLSKCRVKVKTTEPSSDQYRVTDTFSFDEFGNINSIARVGRQPHIEGGYVDMPTRTSSIDWGSSGQFPATVTDAASQSARFVYNHENGTLQEQVDPNGLTTTFDCDLFGRRTRETRPDGTYTRWEYLDCATSGCANDRHVLTVAETVFDRLGAPITDSTRYLDAFERPLVARTRLLSGASWDGSYQWVEADYDSLGRKHHDFFPCKTANPTSGCAGASTTYSYDALGRLVQSIRPRNENDSTPQFTSYGYAGRTQTVTDALGKASVRVTDVDGNVRQIRDANNFAISFAYDGAGSLIGITDSVATTRLSGVVVEYGIEPFVVASTDSALGSSTQQFNSLGELIKWTDAKGQAFVASYDALSRPLLRSEPGVLPTDPLTTTTWTWGSSAANHNIGRLISVSHTANNLTYTETNSYDSLGRIHEKAIQLPESPVQSYTYTHTYDPDKGWLDALAFPVSTGSYRHQLKYGYQNGQLQQVSDASSSAIYWTAGDTNARGQVTQEALGSGIVVSRSFDSVTASLSSIHAGTPSSPTSLQSMSFLYDLVGNVTQRQNNNLSLTESFFYGGSADNLYRLEHSSLVSGSTSGTNLALTYDASGNILTKYEQGSSPQLLAQTIVWTSYNYPQQITGQNESATFWYGPERQRVKMHFTSSGKPAETTFYIGDLLEKVAIGSSVEFRHLIHGGTGPVAIYSRHSSGSSSLRYLLGDNQRSVETIAESDGAPVAHASFTAHGERRDAATWSGPPSDRDLLDSITRQGYTFQTVLGSMGLNHMNGRVQDAMTGRFLSPDPYITETSYTQNYNRYSYLYNNPVTFVDPSGFDCQQNGSSNSSNNDDDDDDDEDGGYQNGSTTAQGMQDCMPEIVVTGVRSSCLTSNPAVCSYSDVMREFRQGGLPTYPYERMVVIRNGEIEEVPLTHKRQKCTRNGKPAGERSRNVPTDSGFNLNGVTLIVHSHGPQFDPSPGGMDSALPMSRGIPVMSVHDSGSHPAGAYVIEPPKFAGDTVHFVNVKNSNHLPNFNKNKWIQNASKGGDADANGGRVCVDMP